LAACPSSGGLSVGGDGTGGASAFGVVGSVDRGTGALVAGVLDVTAVGDLDSRGLGLCLAGRRPS
jgi:hypothetical protein